MVASTSTTSTPGSRESAANCWRLKGAHPGAARLGKILVTISTRIISRSLQRSSGRSLGWIGKRQADGGLVPVDRREQQRVRHRGLGRLLDGGLVHVAVAGEEHQPRLRVPGHGDVALAELVAAVA